MEMFILHRDSNAIGHCSHFIGFCVGIGLGLCYGSLRQNLSGNGTGTGTGTDSAKV